MMGDKTTERLETDLQEWLSEAAGWDIELREFAVDIKSVPDFAKWLAFCGWRWVKAISGVVWEPLRVRLASISVNNDRTTGEISINSWMS